MSRRYSYYDSFESAPTIRSDEGIKARSQQGKIGQSWWAERWISALEHLLDAGRLRRGRSYARSGQVLSITETGTGVKAKVQGSRATPYKVSIEVKALSNEEWERVVDQLAEQAGFAAQLLAGEMPQDIEEAFKGAGVSLFPLNEQDLITDCTCPDWANPCKHVAAAHYILGEQFDEDPFMIFRLRGRTQEQILEGLRNRRAAGAEAETAEEVEAEEPEIVIPLDQLIDRFWEAGERLEGFTTTVKAPAIPFPMLKRLGPPAFLPGQDLAQILGPAYENITQAALACAYDGDEEPHEDQASATVDAG
jgi:uncharacterized Zn finger protein